jgi:hypothetical protein
VNESLFEGFAISPMGTDEARIHVRYGGRSGRFASPNWPVAR